jgi:hypothetical protein
MVPGKYKKIGIATIIMMVSIFLSRVTGLAREMVLAAVSGAGTAVDAYRVAFVLPEILNHILASGFLSVTFIPIFTRALSHGDEKEGWRIFSIILTVFGTLLTILILIGMLLAPTIVPLLAPGRKRSAIPGDGRENDQDYPAGPTLLFRRGHAHGGTICQRALFNPGVGAPGLQYGYHCRRMVPRPQVWGGGGFAGAHWREHLPAVSQSSCWEPVQLE